ncbi:uncharacterized protein LOC110993458 [Pieris rapae]|uniref:uncharacterized protein LOC110993458 n=1 Tax=Pieris rapae TaxID=64459 RepID=UPI001E27F06A|nr:uncharacterized protein LOC110993458 [Pieris rapae]
MENTENNLAFHENDHECDDQEYRHDFITLPWDDRTRRSKISVALLLASILIATLAIVANNFIVHYKNFDANALSAETNINCNLVKVDTYQYVARIRSVVNLELICVGAVLSQSSVLANELCLRSGPIRLHLGSPTDPQCKKGFPVDVFEVIPHDGVITKALVLLSSFDDLSRCATYIKIGKNINFKNKALIIGRPFRGGRSLSLQLVTVDNIDNSTDVGNFKYDSVICVKDLDKCPVRAGDLLVQEGLLYGLASTSVNDRGLKQAVCFANLTLVYKELKLLDATIG